MLERAVIVHASPTLARLKLGSLFNIVRGETFDDELEHLNALFEPKGLVLTVLRQRGGRALMYLYRTGEMSETILVVITVIAAIATIIYAIQLTVVYGGLPFHGEWLFAVNPA